MEVIIKFIFGVTIVVFVIIFLALIGYLACKLINLLYIKYKIDVRGLVYYNHKISYSDMIFTGLFVIGVIMFLIGSVHIIYKLGNYMYFLF